MKTKKIKKIDMKATTKNHSHPIQGLLLLTLGLLTIVALFDYHPSQNFWLTTSAWKTSGNITHNLVGAVGVTIAFWMNYTLGVVSWIVPLFFIWYGCLLMFYKKLGVPYWRYIAMCSVILSLVGIFDILHNYITFSGHISNPNYYPYGAGGILGNILFDKLMQNSLGVFGSSLVLGVVCIASLIASSTRTQTPREAFEITFHRLLSFISSLPKNIWKRFSESIARFKANRKMEALLNKESKQKNLKNLKELDEKLPKKDFFSNNQSQLQKPNLQKELPLTSASSRNESKTPAGLKIIASERVEKAINATPQKRGNYIFPGQDLLKPAMEVEGVSAIEHQQIVDDLIRTLAEFGVNVVPGEVHAGPVVTRYEVIPAAGVRVEKIASLDKNIALALKAHSVRILAPVPGKGAVGIEIPNHKASPVCLRDIIESTAWSQAEAEIPIVLGKEVTGKPLVYDLTKMPHLLIAGSTGSGKTVCINTIITSLLYHSSPDDLRFIMVDPKIVEMQLYNDLPHMLIPVVTNPKKVPGALKWLIKEMEQRYQIFATAGVRNIAGFNAKVLNDRKEKEKALELESELSPEERAAMNNIEVPRDPDLALPKGKLPYIVCIIDELADLMIVAPADIETCIARLAQLARAAGIHLIIATQRPSVNVITGVIKANLPCRIAFKVASKIDSRTILDGGGADQLIGRGDMLFTPPGLAEQVRAQGAYASDAEINAVIEAVKVNGPPDYADEVQREIECAGDDESDTSEEEGDWDDNLVPQAINVLRASKRASTSMLQRRLRIGYNRAARIMEILEAEGIVGPENGQNPREILKDLDLV